MNDSATATMQERALARRRGVKDALGIPAAVPAAGMVGFGALAA